MNLSFVLPLDYTYAPGAVIEVDMPFWQAIQYATVGRVISMQILDRSDATAFRVKARLILGERTYIYLQEV